MNFIAMSYLYLLLSHTKRSSFDKSPQGLAREDFSLYQKLWDLLDNREKVNKSDTKYVLFFFQYNVDVMESDGR